MVWLKTICAFAKRLRCPNTLRSYHYMYTMNPLWYMHSVPANVDPIEINLVSSWVKSTYLVKLKQSLQCNIVFILAYYVYKWHRLMCLYDTLGLSPPNFTDDPWPWFGICWLLTARSGLWGSWLLGHPLFFLSSYSYVAAAAADIAIQEFPKSIDFLSARITTI